jgi:hypothetical protein
MNEQIVQEVNSLVDTDKLRLYMHYYITQLGLKHYICFSKVGSIGWSPPYKVVGETAMHKPWAEIRVKSFSDFFDDSNIVVKTDNWTQYYGAYEWYGKFKEEYLV